MVIRRELGKHRCWSTGVGLKNEIVPGGGNYFSGAWGGVRAAHQIPGFALAGNRNPLVARARDRNVVPSQHTGNYCS